MQDIKELLDRLMPFVVVPFDRLGEDKSYDIIKEEVQADE